jgi:hypothetical protein
MVLVHERPHGGGALVGIAVAGACLLQPIALDRFAEAFRCAERNVNAIVAGCAAG